MKVAPEPGSKQYDPDFTSENNMTCRPRLHSVVTVSLLALAAVVSCGKATLGTNTKLPDGGGTGGSGGAAAGTGGNSGGTTGSGGSGGAGGAGGALGSNPCTRTGGTCVITNTPCPAGTMPDGVFPNMSGCQNIAEPGMVCCRPPDGGVDRSSDTSDSRVDSAPNQDLPADATLAVKCTATGGQIQSRLCCNAESDFPESCGFGSCACAPTSSHDVTACQCPAGTCYMRSRGCVGPDCTPGMDQTCNDNPVISSTHGRCIDTLGSGARCMCNPPYLLNPDTGRCL